MSDRLDESVRAQQLALQEQCRRRANDAWSHLNWRQPEQAMPDRIAAVARGMPDRPAVYGLDSTLTYAELDHAANHAANAILEALGEDQTGVDSQEVVALLPGIAAAAVIGTLAILKAGHIVTGLEASFPRQRSETILADAGVRLIVTDEAHLAQAQALAGPGRRVINLDRLPAAGASAPGVVIPLDSPAILYYTSGSTGVPKGVVHFHRSAFVHGVRQLSSYGVGRADRFALFGSPVWAGSSRKIFGSLCLGAGIGLVDVHQHGLPAISQWLRHTEMTLLSGRPTVLQIANDQPPKRFPAVRLVSLGGQTIHRRDVAACLRVFPEATIAVGLGITEAGRVTDYFVNSIEMLDQEIVPLGLPTPGVQIMLLSAEGQAVQPGEVGEIAVLSNDLAAGYWKRPDLTAERFRPAGELGAAPTYLTGDLGRWRPDGLLEHKGRKDFMVKIRGYQVFTNEIEALLLNVAGASEVCVRPHSLPDGDQRLAAYLVVDKEAFPGLSALHAQFDSLPRHMRPASFVLLDQLPKTATGKVDRARLPLPQLSRLHVSARYVAPRNQMEATLAEIWGEVMGIAEIGVHDDFLELGGDSLQSGRIITQAMQSFRVRVSYQRFMKAMSVAEMAAIILAHGGERVGLDFSPEL